METMASRWRKAKLALGINLCVHVPWTLDDDGEGASPSGGPPGRSLPPTVASLVAEASDSRVLIRTTPTPTSSGLRLSKFGSSRSSREAAAEAPDSRVLMPNTPTPSSSGLRLSKFGSGRSSKRTCAICLETTKPGHGRALFTAECSHTFHFNCAALNVRHGNQTCPVCRAKWKEIPFRDTRTPESSHGRGRVSPVNGSHNSGYVNVPRELHRVNSYHRQEHIVPLFRSTELFNDDEPLNSPSSEACQHVYDRTVEIKTYPEFSAIPQSVSEDNFTIIIHLKAPLTPNIQTSWESVNGNTEVPQTSRAPVDLVTVLDISGSMLGTKLALLKQAMGFVIQNLGPSDRLSVVAFSSRAHRLFALRRMSHSGRQEALQAVNSLVASGGTNIAEGLRKGAKVIEERKEKNPVCSIILLSDGQDSYNLISFRNVGNQAQPNYRSVVPSSSRGGTSHRAPVHVFGFGTDHDSAFMHSISDTSGGTFSFIEAEEAIQDAFAQCIGGILSVVVQEMRLELKCIHPDVHLGLVKSGSYASRVADDRRSGSVVVGDLYADEERNFLVSVTVPPACEETILLEAHCVYKNTLTKEIVCLEVAEVKISRPVSVASKTMSIEVDRQRNRIQATEAMVDARVAAEQGELSQAVTILDECRKKLLQSLAGQSGDELCMTLDAELKEMQARMINHQKYEESGRAYVLSGLSSHSWQRATTRGNSTDSGGFSQAYQTQSMACMLQRSQTMDPATRGPNRRLQHTKSFPARPTPR